MDRATSSTIDQLRTEIKNLTTKQLKLQAKFEGYVTNTEKLLAAYKDLDKTLYNQLRDMVEDGLEIEISYNLTRDYLQSLEGLNHNKTAAT